MLKILLKMSSFLELLLLCCLILLSIIASSQNLDSLFYTRFNEPDNNINLTGVAAIGQNGYIQLTNETSRLMGHAFYASPFKFKNSTNGTVYSFSTCFSLAIVPEYPKLGGHGLAFTIAQSNDFSTALPSQYLGLLNATDVGNFSNHVFAVEFDTVQDFEFGDINDNHVGININSLRSNMSAAAAYFDNQLVKQDLNLKCGKIILVWIEYDSVTNLVNVTLSTSSKKPMLPLFSYRINLSPILKDHMYVGFSASTGLLASSHYIFGWSFKLNGEAKFLDLDSLPSLPGQKKKYTGLIMAISIAAAFCVLSSLLLAIYFIRKFKNADVIESWELEVGPHRYSYEELKQATRGFKDSEMLGHGGFGKVYKGVLQNLNMEIAVKRISHESKQGLREFVSEISSIGRLRHRNLVQLLGWCRRRGDLLLVYDYMPNGSLDNFLFDKPRMILSWEQRFKIIKGVASGLLYLHEGYEQVVVHRDVKASNVLLDGELTAKLGDFGLARLYEHGSNPCTTRVVGTLGYLAPELPRTGQATEKSDVFAFGALLLEVVCGRRPIQSNAGPEELVLVDMVWNKWREGKILDVIDKRLKGEFNESEVMLVLKLGLMCSNNEALARPNMRQVMSYLEGEVGMPDVPMAPGVYNGGFGFDENECLHSLASSSSSKASAHTNLPNGDVDGTFVSTQPLSCLFTDEVPR